MPKVTELKCANCAMTLYATDDQESCPVCGKDPRKRAVKDESAAPPEATAAPTENAIPNEEEGELASSGIAPVFASPTSASAESTSPEGESRP